MNDFTAVPVGPAPLRVLVASHSHPKINNGGAEIAAFRLFTEISACAHVEAWFLGCDNQPGAGRDGVAITQPFTDREYVYSPGGQFDWFRLANPDPRLPDELEALLLELRPDVVHLHHYVNFGVETLLAIRRTLPRAKIVVTLHEYLAICNHFGQMVKRGDFALCDRAGLADCHRCFPLVDPSDFFIRERYIKLFFGYVDSFLAPSRFLADRYAAWGIDAARLTVIENMVAPAAPVADVATKGRHAPLRIGFFGQISKLKGIQVLLDCAKILAEQPKTRISFELYGDHKNQPKIFQDEFLAQLATLGVNVNYRGAYRQEQVDQLMRGVDAVLVPSIWWENSPVVIQEALRNGRPVICSDIGGMAEKVRDGLDGFHFAAGSALELSYLLTQLHDDRTLLTRVRGTIRAPAPMADTLARHLALYESLIAA